MSIPDLDVTGKDIKRIMLKNGWKSQKKLFKKEKHKKLSVFIFPKKMSAKITLVHCAL